ncbi:MAG: Gfo/Idh/MocA family oxidoreductase [Victivallaceae bacterium]|nr:Gfo/Idh/MocA family oxidoreductase [Victivallaceae bacterium]
MKKISLGIIGVNGRGRLWRFWHKPENGVVVAGGADISMDNLQKFKERCNPEAFITTDYRELVERDDLDAIVVATPDRFHAEQVIVALEAGKHVYCEKPLATSIEDCDRILSCAETSKGKLMVGFNMRYMPFVRKMKEIVDSGRIGQIKAVWVRHFVGMGSIYYFHGWHGKRENAASLLLQKGSHDIDAVHYITGQYSVKAAAFGGRDFFGGNKANDLECAVCEQRDSCTDSIVDHLDLDRKPERKYCAFRQEIDMPDNYICMFELGNGIKFSYNECHFTPDYHRNYTFIGTKGRLENSEIDNTIRIWDRKIGRNDQPDEIIDMKQNISPEELELGHGGADPLICDDFIKMIRENSEPPVPALAGRMAVAAGLCAQHSLDNGSIPVELPPGNRIICDSMIF